MTPRDLSWASQPRNVRLYVVACVAAGTLAFAASLPAAPGRPVLFAALIAASCLTSMWKVNLPISMASGSTLSVSYAANLTALLLLGAREATVVAVAGVLTQCTVNVKRSYPWYRTVFSLSSEALTMVLTGVAYRAAGGGQLSYDLALLPKPLSVAIAAYFLVNTGLVAGAIALSTGKPFATVWREDFLWSGVSFFVAGSAGAGAAVVIDRGQGWLALLLLAPVYLTYRTYQVFVARLDDQKRHLAEIEDARAHAEQANHIKDQFLAVVSHELRTPLNAILGWADMLRNGTLQDGRRDRATQAIYDSAKRQAQLVDELLDVSRIMSGTLQLERSLVALTETVHAAVEVVQPAAEAKRIHIGMDLDPGVGTFIGDGQRLQQIVWNLLTNAIKFTPEGGTIRVDLRRARDVIELTVRDTGSGIPAHFLPSMFEPFRQAEGSTTRHHGGLGLGLAIVKNLVDAHGGTITAQNNSDGLGSTLTVRLPALRAAAGQRPMSIEQPPAPTEPIRPSAMLDGVRVLVVDDDDESREVVVAFLEAHRAEVFTARSASEGMAFLGRRHVDVLLADIAMPGEDGYQLIKKIRQLSQPAIAGIPAAALTAFARDDDRRQALEAGFHEHLTKPIDPRTLVGTVSQLARLAQV